MKNIKTGDWVVCLNWLGEPSTWGKVTRIDSNNAAADIKYSHGAPIWNSPYWSVKHLLVCESEDQARERVENFEK